MIEFDSDESVLMAGDMVFVVSAMPTFDVAARRDASPEGPFATLGDDDLAWVRRYGADVTRRGVEVDVLEADAEDVPETYAAFTEWLEVAVDGVPLPARAGLRVSLLPKDYDDHYGPGRLRIWYWRPETDDEMAARLHGALAEKRRQEGRDRLEFERLKVRFG